MQFDISLKKAKYVRSRGRRVSTLNCILGTSFRYGAFSVLQSSSREARKLLVEKWKRLCYDKCFSAACGLFIRYSGSSWSENQRMFLNHWICIDWTNFWTNFCNQKVRESTLFDNQVQRSASTCIRWKKFSQNVNHLENIDPREQT